MASGRWASPGPAWASRRPLQAQVVLKSASPGPAPASQQASSFGSAPAQLPPAFVDPELSPAMLLSPTCLPVACTGPGLAGEQPLQAPLLPPRGISRPSSGLTAASRDQVPACLPAACVRPSSSVTVACSGPTHASGTLSRGVSPCLTLASLTLREFSVGPCLTLASLTLREVSMSPCLTLVSLTLRAILPHAGLLRPSSCLCWPFQAQPLPVGGL
uniref:Putative uncharacterized protein FLJ46235 n=2 Tax=Homo sapiens TaxID=9606 RepID=YG024_HUMAN|nr:RecName: Full=Putative uncharacterized protein FLJ46235 [Homo sapiens]AFT92038.1 BC215 protein [Homo sapiens]BAC87281.1 unnamed protein product [Homo sapiens]